MRRALLAMVAAAALPCVSTSAALAGGARSALEEGFDLFAARRYDEAAARFAAAAAKAGEEGLDPAVAGYDQAIALLRAGKGAEAGSVLTEVLRSPDPGLREAAHYHRGLALTGAAEAAAEMGDARRAAALLDEALAAYESAMRLDPRDEDPKVNHELVARRKAQLEEQARGREQGPSSGRAGDAKPDEGAEGAQSPEAGRARQETGPAPRGSTQKEMRPDAARALLDAMRQQEQSQRSRTQPSRGQAPSVEKDW